MRAIVERMGRHQIPRYLGGLALGAVVGLAVPAIAPGAERAVTGVLALLLYATFLGLPIERIGGALRDRRFLGTMLLTNFVLVPLVVWQLSLLVADDRALLIGVLLVLLTPCIDYVIVFTGIAGGDAERLVAASPLLMLGQMLLLPAFLWMLAGEELARAIDLAPFLEAFAFLIVLPLLAAALTRRASGRSPLARRVGGGMQDAMVPLMVATLAVVVASQIAGVGDRLGDLLRTVPVYVLFAAAMGAFGLLAGRLARLDVPGRRALVLSGVTRNSLVVLPLALALPAAYALAPLAVVTQTLVELIVLVMLVRLVPRLVPADGES
ncbi:bile acid:sodium symporter [Brachybacterium muris]|uniref:arsenic resistance protein n=1 Tax=Brachybacterium muris TaxID=219301 RepID=UPI0021A513B6|nr:bile acid:sodium symporter [Brachybacterium muris]MCT1429514.1 bile acid:sodium symporter [Brachybacterium muris]MCT1998018.1 bile acid:sodium symporter [Brachybacterium muris]